MSSASVDPTVERAEVEAALQRARQNLTVQRWMDSTSGLLHAHLTRCGSSGMIDVSRTAKVRKPRVPKVGGNDRDLYPLPWPMVRGMLGSDPRPYRSLNRPRARVLLPTFLPSDGACPIAEQALGEHRAIPAGVGFVQPLTRRQKKNRRRAEQRRRARGE
jgi:hypothetical protein